MTGIGAWESGYDSGTSTVVGSVGAGNGLQDVEDLLDFDTPFASILGQTHFRLTAAVSVNPGTAFFITIFDQEGDTAAGTFSWSSFGSGLSSVQVPISFNAAFDSPPLGWELDTFGVGEAITVQFDRLEAIPEPSGWCLFVLGAASLCFRRKAGNLVQIK